MAKDNIERRCGNCQSFSTKDGENIPYNLVRNSSGEWISEGVCRKPLAPASFGTLNEETICRQPNPEKYFVPKHEEKQKKEKPDPRHFINNLNEILKIIYETHGISEDTSSESTNCSYYINPRVVKTKPSEKDGSYLILNASLTKTGFKRMLLTKYLFKPNNSSKNNGDIMIYVHAIYLNNNIETHNTIGIFVNHEIFSQAPELDDPRITTKEFGVERKLNASLRTETITSSAKSLGVKTIAFLNDFTDNALFQLNQSLENKVPKKPAIEDNKQNPILV